MSLEPLKPINGKTVQEYQQQVEDIFEEYRLVFFKEYNPQSQGSLAVRGDTLFKKNGSLNSLKELIYSEF